MNASNQENSNVNEQPQSNFRPLTQEQLYQNSNVPGQGQAVSFKKKPIFKKWWFWLIIGIVIIAAVASAVGGAGAGGESNSNEIKMPAAALEFQGKNYNDVMTELETAGFTNVTTEAIDDLVTGWLTKDGEVEEVSVNGETDYSSGAKYLKDAKIVIRYHTFPDVPAEVVEEEPAVVPKEEPVEVVEEEPAKVNESEAAENDKVENTTKKAKDKILTAKNNKELAAVFKVKNPGDPIIKAFAEKYLGRTIEFDGYIFESYSEDGSLYDVFPVKGNSEDGDQTLLLGPNMKMERVSESEFPECLKTNNNVHIKAKIGGSEEGNGGETTTLILEPISVEAR